MAAGPFCRPGRNDDDDNNIFATTTVVSHRVTSGDDGGERRQAAEITTAAAAAAAGAADDNPSQHHPHEFYQLAETLGLHPSFLGGVVTEMMADTYFQVCGGKMMPKPWI